MKGGRESFCESLEKEEKKEEEEEEEEGVKRKKW